MLFKQIDIYASYTKALFVISIFFLPYFMDGWWKFIPSTILICITYNLTSNILWKTSLNALTKHKSIVKYLLLLAVLYATFKVAISYIIAQYGISSKSIPQIWLLSTFFQVFNEEMILRGTLISFMLTAIEGKVRNIKIAKYAMVILIALIFAILHYLFYLIAENISLNCPAMCALFLFGIICNLLFLQYKHIWFGYIIHLSWNLTRFNNEYYLYGAKLSEGKLYNLLEGNYIVIIALFVILILVFLLFIRDGNA